MDALRPCFGSVEHPIGQTVAGCIEGERDQTASFQLAAMYHTHLRQQTRLLFASTDERADLGALAFKIEESSSVVHDGLLLL